eukprot:1832013-Alexandrium_andersonii.AAC.1
MPASSASPELKAMVFCVVDKCLMACNPLTHTPSAGGSLSALTPSKASVNIRAEGAHRPAAGSGGRTAGARSSSASAWPELPSPRWYGPQFSGWAP